MAILGMTDAAQRLGVHRGSVRRTLLELGVPLIRIHGRALAVEETDLMAAIAEREARGIHGPGRPRGQSVSAPSLNSIALIDAELRSTP